MSFLQLRTLMSGQESLWFLAWVAQQRKIYPSSSILGSYFRLQKKIQEHDGFRFPLDPEFSDWKNAFMSISIGAWNRFFISLHESLSLGRQLLYPGHPFYPFSFLQLNEVPFLLHLEGSPIWLGLPGLSVVGSREPSDESLQWLEENLAPFIEKTPSFTVSGGARGVDQRVHRISLRKNIPTVAFLPAGLNQLYPETLYEIRDLILYTGGALVSEFDPDQRMAKHHFAQRNRLIAAMGELTLVIEAKRRSGTLLTAKAAIEQGRPLLVLPTHPLDRLGQGGLDLICEGATPIRDEADLTLFFRSEQRMSQLIPKIGGPCLGGGVQGIH